MTGSEIKALNTSIRGGRALDDVTFYTLANLSRATWEGKRPWRQLLTVDSSNTSDASGTFATPYTLPARFAVASNRKPLTLTNGTTRIEYIEVPLEDFDERRYESGLFAIDLAQGEYYLSGSVPQGTWTHKFNYARRSPLIAADTEWVFPDDYHPYIAFEVAVMDQLGIDYDDTNARQGAPNASRADMLLQVAIRWDDALMRSALRGVSNNSPASSSRDGGSFNRPW